ncbi:adenine-specific methyltransferase [Polaribacter phage P12002S]|uniref:Adenine-specific methyltransferase n=1 Tax=Polaribacter phage P12002S TaxID=1647387 RepID=A0A0F7INC8_9CAUD|nr:adenine-specific methyltransferase [Polaribacter phage P12002S]AKG94310.1 adenine-specific methyltransferase [Polaribacter phage P12002S]
MSKIKLIQGETIEEMQKLIDKGVKVDMILCDLPYGTTACKWDEVIPFNLLWDKYEKLIKDKGAIVLTASQPFTSALVMSNPKLFKYEWIWEKSKASNFLQAKYMPLKAHENILVFGRGKVNYYPQKTQGKPFNKGNRKNDKGIATEVYNKIPNAGMEIKNEKGLRNPRTVQYFKTAESEGKHHPTQKPTWLFEYLIKTYTLEGETVLDNTMGAGTTAIACKNTNRNFIGIELESKYFNTAVSRTNEPTE